MYQALNAALIANTGILQHALMQGPIGELTTIGVVLGDITQIDCDAYVVPYGSDDEANGRLIDSLVRAGAERGVSEYKVHSRQLGRSSIGWGDLLVTESGGGRSSHLIHVSAMGDHSETRAIGSVEYAVFASLQVAMDRGFDRVVFPALYTGEGRPLAPEASAKLMLSAIFKHWKEENVAKPSEVLIAIGNGWLTYLSFIDVFKEASPTETNPAELRNGGTLTRSEAFIPTRQSIRNVIAELSPSALMAFFFAAKGDDALMYERCSIQPWWNQVRVLFTEREGRDLNPVAREELRKRFFEVS